MEALIFDLVKDSIGSLLQATAGFISQNVGLVRRLEADLNKLQQELRKVHALLLGAESKLGFGSPEFENPLLREWVKEVAQVAYRAEDVMDEYAYELLKHKFDSEDTAERRPLALRLGSISKVQLFSRDSPVWFRQRMSQEVKSLRESIAEIYANAKDLGINPSLVAAGASLPSSSDRDAISAAEKQLQWRRENVDYEGLIGRQEFIEQIKKELREASNSDKRLTVIGIYGMGGSGKTAVSRKIFKAAEGKEYFQKQIWICISHDFDFQKLLKAMLEQLDQQSTVSEVEAIKNSLREKLQGKKFFLVLDDVWDTFPAAWEPFRCCLQDMSEFKGNTILVTSRSKDVLTKLKTYNAMQSIDDPCIHKLPGLTPADSRSLFKQRVGDDSLFDSTKAQLAKNILEKCDGLPLAIRTVADLLRSRDIRTWKEIEASGIWNEQDDIMPSIKLSFKYLPSVALKKCFVYCAIFREDEVIKKDRLIQLWMAQGFLQHPDDELEKVGEEYFYVLLNNSLFQDPVFDAKSGNVVSCKMHDVVHDLARALSSNDVTQQVQHLSLLDYEQCRSSLEAGNNLLRTLLLSNNSPKLENFSNNMIKYLRALILDDFGIEELPDSIGELKHLRYLQIPCIKSLPDGLVKLYNLQTLRIEAHSGFPVFPKGLNKLVNLRHVCSHSFSMRIPVGLGMLTSLRTLPTINALQQWGGKLSELQTLSKLKRLRIEGLEHVEVQEAKEVKLGMKNNINELFLSWEGRHPTGDDLLENEKMVLEALQPHANLSSLEILRYDAKEFPPWVREMTGYGGSPFSNLVRLRINCCYGLEHLPTSLKNLIALKQLIILDCWNAVSFPSHLECLTSLQDLELTGCYKMENIIADIAPLVNLRKVIIRDCRNMTCLPTGISDLPRLEELKIGVFSSELDMFPFPTIDTNGNEIIGRSKFKSLVELHLFGDGMDKVKSLPNSIQYLNQLRNLDIWKFRSLEALPEWLGDLTSLRELLLGDLPNLKSLPSRAAIRHLTRLVIHGCPQLKEACARGTGAEWPKLQHIPNVSIDYEQLTGEMSDDSDEGGTIAEFFHWLYHEISDPFIGNASGGGQHSKDGALV